MLHKVLAYQSIKVRRSTNKSSYKQVRNIVKPNLQIHKTHQQQQQQQQPSVLRSLTHPNLCSIQPSLSTSSSNQEHCFTPTSTLTSHSQSSTCSDQNTPTPGSPSNNGAIINTSHLIYGTAKFNGGYGIINEDLYECRTLQVPTLLLENS